MLDELFPLRGLKIVNVFRLFRARAHGRAKLFVRPSRLPDAEHGEVAFETTGVEEIVEGWNKFAFAEIARRPEDDDHGRLYFRHWRALTRRDDPINFC